MHEIYSVVLIFTNRKKTMDTGHPFMTQNRNMHSTQMHVKRKRTAIVLLFFTSYILHLLYWLYNLSFLSLNHNHANVDAIHLLLPGICVSTSICVCVYIYLLLKLLSATIDLNNLHTIPKCCLYNRDVAYIDNVVCC